MVLSVQTAKEFVRFGAADSVGGIVAIAMARELAPILAGVVVAGRIGAAIAAEIGTMKVTEQIDALRVMATSPTQYLVAPRFLAIVLMMPILVIYANLVGDIGGGFVAMNYAGIGSHMFMNPFVASLNLGTLWAASSKVPFLVPSSPSSDAIRALMLSKGPKG